MSVLWTPAGIATALWLDAADSSTITESSGAVSEWRDKSGNSRHATQGVSANQPTVSTVNSINALLFDGVSEYMAVGSAVIPTTHSLFMVIVPTIEAVIGAALGQWAPSETGRFGVAINQNAGTGDAQSGLLNIFNASATNGSAAAGLANHTAIANEPTLVESICNTGTEQWKLLKNGTEYESATVPSVYQGINTSIGILSPSLARYPYDGLICEVVIVGEVVSAATRQLIEGYLAHKWGLAANLPSDHPYKSAAPTALVLSGVVTVNSSPAQRTVLVYKNDDADLFASTQSDATTGDWQVIVDGEETDRYRVVMVGESGEYSKVFEDVTAG